MLHRRLRGLRCGRRKRHYRRNGRAVNYRALVAAADRALARATA